MLKLFLVPPTGKGNDCWVKYGSVGCYCSNPNRGPFYVSKILSSEGKTGKLLLQLGSSVASLAIRMSGAAAKHAAKRFVDRIQFTDATGDEPVGVGVLAAKALYRSITFNLVSDAEGIRAGANNKMLTVGMDYKCHPKRFAEQAVFLAGFWGVIK